MTNLKTLIKIKMALLSIFLSFYSVGQSKMTLEWKSNHGFKAELIRTWNDLGTLFIGASETELSAIDENGKQLYRYTFNEKFGMKKAADGNIYNDDIIELIFEVSKKADPIKILLDAKSGQEIWRSGQDQSKYLTLIASKPASHHFNRTFLTPSSGANKNYGSSISIFGSGTSLKEILNSTGDKMTYRLFHTESQTNIDLSYDRKVFRAATGKSVILTLSTSKNSNVLWSTDFNARVITTMVSDEDMLDFYVANDKIFVIYEGISVFDLNTGKLIWKSEFNNSEVSFGLKAKQELNIADYPLVTTDGVYIVDLTSETYGIKKVDLETGKILWKSPKYSGSDIIPFISIQNGALLAKFGGIINVQTYIPNSNGGATYKTEFLMKGKAGIKAYDPGSGKLLWDEKKLGYKFSFLSDFIQSDGQVSFFSDKGFYTVNAKTGEVKHQFPFKSLKPSKLILTWLSDDLTKAYAAYDDGLVAVDLKTGTLLYESNIKDLAGMFRRGDVYFAKTGKEQDKIVAIDLETGDLLGILEATYKNVTEDGRHVVIIDWGAIERYKVK